MDEKLLHQILLTVEEVKTVSELANRLYLSQPYVSQLISKAEQHYHVQLVNRKKIPISLTPAGKELIKGMEKIINDRKQIEQKLEQYFLKRQSLIKIALTPIWISSKTSKLIAELQQSFPDIQFEIYRVFTSADSVKMLENRSVDIFWGALLHDQGLISTYLYRSAACIIIPPSHPLYEKDQTEIQFSSSKFNQLNGSEMVALTDNSAFQKIVDHLFEDDGIKFNKKIKVNDFIGAGQLALDGFGITVTLNDVLDYLHKDDRKYNIMQIPTTIINLDVGISINEDSSAQVKSIAKKLCDILIDHY